MRLHCYCAILGWDLYSSHFIPGIYIDAHFCGVRLISVLLCLQSVVLVLVFIKS